MITKKRAWFQFTIFTKYLYREYRVFLDVVAPVLSSVPSQKDYTEPIILLVLTQLATV